MSVVIETTLGDITVDLFINDRPRACLNFLKLCKIKYYNYNLFHTINRGFVAQTGDPSGSRNGGESIYGVLDGSPKRFFEGENEPRIKHTKMGLISFVGNDDHMIGSQFFFTLGEDLTYLDEKHCVFGEVVEGFDILEGINEVICDNDNRPYQDVRITHTVVLDDPFPDPKKLIIPSRSPSPSDERLKGGRIAPDEEIDEMEGKTPAEVVEMQAEREAKARATILEMVGDLPDADMAPPENVLFVCKLNPVTSDDDLEIIFSRFGKIKSCEVIRDKKTGDSLQYAFVEFEDKTACENAYFKMDNVLIDDRRIHVDFSQSVSKVKWRGKGRGVTHYDEKGRKSKNADSDIGKGNYKHKKNNENSETRSYKARERSRSPTNKTQRTGSSETKRSLTPKRNRSKNDKEYSRNSKHNDNRSSIRQTKSPSPERRRKYSRSPTPNRNTYKSSNRDKYMASSRQRKYSPSPPRRNRDNKESSSSTRYRKRSASPKRKKDSSPVSKRGWDNTPDKKRRSRSSTPRKDDGKRNGNYEKSDRNYKNPSTSSHKATAEKKSHKKQKSVSSNEESDSESDSRSKRQPEKHSKKNVKTSSDKKKIRESPERKRSGKQDKKKEEKKRKKRKDSSSSEESGSDSDIEVKKRAAPESESSDSDYKKRKSKKKKSKNKKSKHNDSSSDSDYKKKTKKKKKYESDSD